jgi:hypothetical protein
VTVGARRRAGQPQWHRHTFGGLQEAQLGFGFQVVATSRTAWTRRSAAPEQAAEQVADVAAAGAAGGVEQIVEVELSAVAAPAEAAGEVAAVESASESATGEEPTGFVVLLALCRIRQDFFGL